MNDGWTALIYSAVDGYLDIAKHLIDHEAGIKSNDGRTATMMAISEYQPSCLQILLASQKEREVSQIPQIMLAAYRGDIRYLLEHQREWSTIHNRLTVLDFALLGGQRRVVWLLASSEKIRRNFAGQFSSRFDKWNSIPFARRFLTAHAQLISDILPFLHLTTHTYKTYLLTLALEDQLDNASCALRTICTPDADSLFQYLKSNYKKPECVSVLKKLKHVGISFYGKTLENLAQNPDGPVSHYVQSNPLKRAQAKRAKKEVQKKRPNEKQACWRETEAESTFNGSLVTQSKGVTWHTSPVLRLARDSSTNQIRRKQALNRQLLLDFVRSMQKIVQDMLDE